MDMTVIPYNSTGQVLVLDCDADLHLDLFGTEQTSQQRMFWKNSGNGITYTLYVIERKKQLSKEKTERNDYGRSIQFFPC